MIDKALAGKIRRAARKPAPAVQGKRKDVSLGNFAQHVCHICGTWMACEMEKCNHAVCVRVLSCCDPNVLERKKKR